MHLEYIRGGISGTASTIVVIQRDALLGWKRDYAPCFKAENKELRRTVQRDVKLLREMVCYSGTSWPWKYSPARQRQ